MTAVAIPNSPTYNPKAPRRHQIEAVAALAREIGAGGRAQVIHACGTGKTRTAAMFADHVGADCILVALPSLDLVAQTMDEWSDHFGASIDFRAVCSDRNIYDSDNLPLWDNRVLMEPSEIAHFLAFRTLKPIKVLFTTYQSSGKIAAAVPQARALGWNDFDLLISDEAHRLAGRPGRAYSTVLSQHQIPAHRRVFLTATPRVTNPHKPVERVVAMDDEATFGKIAHQYTFSEATRDGILCPYRLTVLGIDPDDLKYVNWPENTDDALVRHNIGLAATLKAMHATGARRMVTFHNSQDRSERFARDLDALNGRRLNGAHVPDLTAVAVHSGMNSNSRRAAMSVLDPKYPKPSVVSNPRVLTEGIDVPTLDGVVFIDPRVSVVDTTQVVGRALRTSPGKRLGHIIVPVIMRPGEKAEEATKRSGFEMVWRVLAILRDLDNDLAAYIDDSAADNQYQDNLGGLDFDIPSSFSSEDAARLALVARVRAVDHTASIVTGRDTIEVWCSCCHKILLDRIHLR